MSNLEKLATLIPLEILEQECQKQIYEALKLEFLLRLGVMPDSHTGYHLPIGGVALLDGVISPSYVGYDKGCGVACIITDIPWDEIASIAVFIFNRILERIPVGFAKHERWQEYKAFTSASGDNSLSLEVNQLVHKQLGTLGGNNHFIEVGPDEEGYTAVVIHSGSRKGGHDLAEWWMKKADIEHPELGKGFLHLDSDLGQGYLQDLDFMLQYALDNRLAMMRQVLGALGCSPWEIESYIKYRLINENHNHAVVTPEGVLHRKGATPADLDQFGLIPGDMSVGTYVTRGLGNKEFLSSASHGAGRTMSRGKAKKTLSMDRMQGQMQGIVATVTPASLHEAPDAYKDLEMVINMQKGVVIETVDFIKSAINIKGHSVKMEV